MTLDVAHKRLHNQYLFSEKLNTPNEVVAWQGAIQSQDYAGAKWAIGLRTSGLTDADLDRAFAEGSILRTHILRPTWHFVTPEDIRWMLALSGPRVHAVNAFMYRKLEVDKATLKKSYAVLQKWLRHNNHLMREELGSALQKVGIHAEGPRLAYIIMSAELDGLICSGPRRGKRFTYALLEERVPRSRELTREQGLAELTTRYFQSHGPATLQDFCIWSGLTMADARTGMEMVKSQFPSDVINEQTYWFRETPPPAKSKTPVAHLLPNYDEYFIGFKDRSAMLKFVQGSGIKKDDPSLLANIVALNGQVIGGWRRTLKKKSVAMQADLILELRKKEMHAVIEAAEHYANFLNLPFSLDFAEQQPMPDQD